MGVTSQKWMGKSTLAPCREACPAGIDVPRYIRHIQEKDFSGALAVIRERIPFPAVCGYACVHPCEAKCARVQYDEAITIRLLKRAAEEQGRGEEKSEKVKGKGKKVAVIGSGPCGLTAAYYLCGLGYGVTVYESLSEAGGMLRYGIPGYRLPKKVVDREIGRIRSRGVRIKTGAKVTSAAGLLKEGYSAVLVSTGAWKSAKLRIEGEESLQVLEGIAFLREVNEGKRPLLGKRVLVVGGGNTAVDAARASVRLGAKVEVLYRRKREDMPALAEEILEAEEEGVRIRFMVAPVKISKGKAVCIMMAPGPADGSGRPAPVPIEGSEFSVPFDSVVMAVGQSAEASALDLSGNRNGTIKVNGSLSTSVPGVFAAGDAVLGPKTIIDAIAQGRAASQAIDRYLGGQGRIDPRASAERREAIPEAKPRGVKRGRSERLPAKTRVNDFRLVEAGFDAETAVCEARRCLSCDLRQYLVEVDPVLCKDCGYCREMCQQDIFALSNSFNASGYKPTVVKSSDRCVACLKCVYICPDLAIKVVEGKVPDCDKFLTVNGGRRGGIPNKTTGE